MPGAKENFKKKCVSLKKRFGSFSVFVAEHLLVSCFVILASALFLTGFVYYQYGFSAEYGEINDLAQPFDLDEEAYQKVVEVWDDKRKDFETAEKKNYAELFEQFSAEEE